MKSQIFDQSTTVVNGCVYMFDMVDTKAKPITGSEIGSVRYSGLLGKDRYRVK